MSLPPLLFSSGIAYRESGNHHPAAIVLLHGIGSTSAVWREQYAPLGERFRVIAWTAPGYDRSAPLAGDSPSADAYANALVRLLDALGIASAHVVTNSWGTLVGLAFATHYPKRARALVLGGPTVGAHGLTSEARAARTAERIALIEKLGPAKMREQGAASLVSSSASPQVLSWAGAGSGEFPTVAGYAQAARMLYSTDAVALVEKLSNPVMVISGTEDRITPPDTNARRLVAAARKARFAPIEGAGHLPHLEKPAQFNAAVLDFLEG
jgi:pimeloyl-ACP methyl ester carboxylesterase